MNDVEPEEFVEVVEAPEYEHPDADFPDRLNAYGPTSSGKYIVCIYALVPPGDYVYPITAMKSSPKRAKRRRPK